MKLKNAIGALILGATLVSPFGKTLNAAQTSGNTRIKVTLPEIIILHYISEISLNFTTDLTTRIDEQSGSWTTAWDGTNSAGTNELANGASHNLEARPTFELDGNTTINTSVPNVWAVRGLAPNAEATVTITQGKNTTLTHTHSNGSDTITLSGFTISSPDETTGVTMDVALNGIARADATVGGVNFTMDLSLADSAGEYENADGSGFEYTISATTI